MQVEFSHSLVTLHLINDFWYNMKIKTQINIAFMKSLCSRMNQYSSCNKIHTFDKEMSPKKNSNAIYSCIWSFQSKLKHWKVTIISKLNWNVYVFIIVLHLFSNYFKHSEMQLNLKMIEKYIALSSLLFDVSLQFYTYFLFVVNKLMLFKIWCNV